ncbi:SIR2 family protein [Verrucomicrobiota bacterium sgz303538]
MPPPEGVTGSLMDWSKPHIYRAGTAIESIDSPPEKVEKHRRAIEPWLSALFQSEHLSLLVGNGLTTGVSFEAGVKPVTMAGGTFPTGLDEHIQRAAAESAEEAGRGDPNIEDQLRVAIALADGLRIIKDKRVVALDKSIGGLLSNLIVGVLETEKSLKEAFENEVSGRGSDALRLLTSFLLSFAARSASRERLHVFTTNYDRLLEYAADALGIRMIDRFVGSLAPVFRSSRVEVDYHYNPPGIRGEPRYIEVVVRFSKLHGSLDWRYQKPLIRKFGLPFGAPKTHSELAEKLLAGAMIYPNAAKDMETIAFPYAELFRDFACALCRPNSTLVTYGYSFGDDHINRIIQDMLTIPSTHLVIISFDKASGRVQRFWDKVGKPAQISLLIGSHFAHLATLVSEYLPKAAIDTVTMRKAELLSRRGEISDWQRSGTSFELAD